MQLIPHPMALPGCCFKCRTGSENRQFFIDFDFSFDDFGAVILCDECVYEMGHAANMITSKEFETLKQNYHQALVEVEEIRIINEGLEQAIDGLRLAGSSTRTYSNANPSLLDEATEPEPLDGQVELDSGEGTSAESLHDSGVAELSDDAATDGTFTLNI